MTVYTTLPTDDLNLAVTVTDDPDLVVLNITPAAVNLTASVNSVNTFTGDVVLGSDNIAEGSSNLYYTNARADARVNLQTGANLDLSNKDTGDLAEGSNLYYTDSRANSAVDARVTKSFVDNLNVDADTLDSQNGTYYLDYGNFTNTPTIPTNNNQLSNGASYITASSTDALTNKSGNISQWTNDSGYLTSETDSQTLSFSTPTLTISGGNNVNLTPLKTTSLAFSAITATPTTVAGYGITDAFDGAFASLSSKPTTISGYGITDAFDGAYGSLTGTPTIPTNNNQLTNGAGYTTNTGTVTPSSTDAFTNKSGSNSQWTNDEAYIKANSTETLTNKSGNVSMFANDAGYLTTETDSQTLSFTSPNLSISNGNSVDLSGLIDGGTY
jgi:hypothetical protein